MKQRITGSYIFSYLLIPGCVLTLYFLTYSLTPNWLSNEGVNTAFADRSWKLILLLTILSALSFVIVKIRGSEKGLIKLNRTKLTLSDLVLVLLPLTPVVQYIIVNQGILSGKDLLIIIGFFFFSSLLIIFLIPKLLETIGSIKVLMALGVAFTTTLTSMSLLSKRFNWYYSGSLKIQVLLFVFIFFIAFLSQSVNKNDKRFIYLIILIFFVSNSTIQWVSKTGKYTQSAQAAIDQKMFSVLKNKTPKSTPNIYLLIYDSYIGNETLLSLGIDNSKQEEFLE